MNDGITIDLKEVVAWIGLVLVQTELTHLFLLWVDVRKVFFIIGIVAVVNGLVTGLVITN